MLNYRQVHRNATSCTQSAPLSHRPSQHSQSDTARHNSSHKIFINRIPIPPVAPSQTQPATFSEKHRTQNHSKDRYTSAVLGHTPLRLAPRRVLFSHTHPSLMRPSSLPAPLQALPRLPQDEEPRTPPRWGATGSRAQSTHPTQSSSLTDAPPTGARPRLRTQCVQPALPTSPARGPLGPGGCGLT